MRPARRLCVKGARQRIVMVRADRIGPFSIGRAVLGCGLLGGTRIACQ